MNVARLLYIGSHLLHYSEAEIFRMTLRKFYLIYDEYLIYNRLKKKESDNMLDLL